MGNKISRKKSKGYVPVSSEGDKLVVKSSSIQVNIKHRYTPLGPSGEICAKLVSRRSPAVSRRVPGAPLPDEIRKVVARLRDPTMLCVHGSMCDDCAYKMSQLCS